MRRILSILFIAAAITPAEAYSVPKVTNENVNKECSACHMTFQPQLLPQRSWTAIMKDLPNHFGEDASLTDVAVLQEITSYLVDNAGDAKGENRGLLRRLPPDATPLRISELPQFVRNHKGEVSEKSWAKAGSKANCVACHQNAANGEYEDD